MAFFSKLFKSYSQKELERIEPVSAKVLALEDRYAAMSDAELRACTPAFRERLAKGEALDALLPEAFAVCREAAWRVLGMKHFPVQITGGVVLHQGRIAEMKTGEGKTLVATLPVYLNALTGAGVHVVTVNDYLAKRDSEWMGKVYRFLGLTVGLAIPGMDIAEKREAYACDITYGTNNEMGFDYLRDNMVVCAKDKVQRGFPYAIVDEVDSILIDEARTPLIISGHGEESSGLYAAADRFVRTLRGRKVAEADDKAEIEDLGEGDYVVEEKGRTVNLTAAGIAKAERYFKVENLTDPENSTLAHHINQAVKAHGVMVRDVDYVVKDGEIIIVDEFTGRLMLGRRYNEGLHQAIEAKEGVTVARESKTLATITLQNYFRMYKKLAGMTGTALTEESEFREIYRLDVVEVPTNKKCIRLDQPDLVYKTEAAKYEAVIEEILRVHEKGQPVLVGTVSIEKSELLSKLLSRRGVEHNVLNAKHHEREALIVAQAGKYGAVTIATNMAGRGTDIMLGGNPEFMAKTRLAKEGLDEALIEESTAHSETDDPAILDARARYRSLYERSRAEIAEEAERVRAAGGLYIIGTERHESRRIDNQLRGRSGRQGDPGESRFFLSLEDDLMRLFGGERIQSLMNTLKVEDDQPIEAKILTGTIESAQAKVEGRNFSVRKRVLQYDDVMNKQREIIYGQRDQVLSGADIAPILRSMGAGTISAAVDRFTAGTDDPDFWDLPGLIAWLGFWLPRSGEDEKAKAYSLQDLEGKTPAEMKTLLSERLQAAYETRAASWGELRGEIERAVLLRNVDTKWVDHIDAMDELRRGIGLRALAQKDPTIEYRFEGFEMFDELRASIREDTIRQLMTVRLRPEAPIQRVRTSRPIEVPPTPEVQAKRRQEKKKKVGPNDPCPCGSGKKYKKCCGR